MRSKALARVMIWVLLGMLLAGPVSAQESGAACAAIVDDASRLACYDRLFRSDAAPTEAGVVTIESERLIPALPTGRGPAEMIVACESGALTVQFRFAGQLVSVSGDIAPVTFQVDQNATIVRSLAVSPDNAAVGFWTTRESAAFLDTLAGGRNLKVRMTPIRQRSLTVDFRLEERAGEIEDVRKACAG